MIYGTVNGQVLTYCADKIVSDTIDYITAEFKFSKDWDEANKWAHFTQGETSYVIPLVNDRIPEEAHLNLSEGTWQMYLHGTIYDGELEGEILVQRITTTVVSLKVEKSGILDGEPLGEIPASVAEVFEARIKFLEDTGGGGSAYHDSLLNRDLSDQHPMEAISGLSEKLDYLEENLGDKNDDYAIIKSEDAEEGYSASYHLEKNGEKVGATINIPKDFLVRSAHLYTVVVDDVPVEGYRVGQKYIDFVVNSIDDEEQISHLYLNVNELVDVYKPGEGIEISLDNTITLVTQDGSKNLGGITKADYNEFKSAVTDTKRHTEEIKGLTEDIEQINDEESGILAQSKQYTNQYTGAKTVTGESISVTNSVKYPLLGLSVYGKSTQDGTPSPTNPVPIVSVGDDGELKVQSCGKNLLKVSMQETIINGVSFVPNSDDSITINGTATANILTAVVGKIALKANVSYALSGCPAGGGAFAYRLDVRSLDFKLTYALDVGEGAAFTVNEDGEYNVIIRVHSSAVVDNVTLYPMIRFASIADDTYEPYTGSTASITSVLPLCGKDDAYDELIYRPNGTGKGVKRVRKKRITSDTLLHNDGWIDGGWGIANFLEGAENIVGHDTNAYLWCTHGASYAPSKLLTDAASIGVGQGGGVNLYCNFGAEYNTEELIKGFLSDNEVYVVYELATPEEIELTAEEMAQIKQLYSYNGVTNIFNDEQAEMSVKYCTSPLMSECWLPLYEAMRKESE